MRQYLGPPTSLWRVPANAGGAAREPVAGASRLHNPHPPLTRPLSPHPPPHTHPQHQAMFFLTMGLLLVAGIQKWRIERGYLYGGGRPGAAGAGPGPGPGEVVYEGVQLR